MWKVLSSNSLLTVSRRLFCCGSLLPVFGVRVSVTCHLIFVHIIFSSFWVAEWPPFGKELLTRLTICSLRSWTICNFSYFPFWFGGGGGVDLGSDCSVPGHCILVTFSRRGSYLWYSNTCPRSFNRKTCTCWHFLPPLNRHF